MSLLDLITDNNSVKLTLTRPTTTSIQLSWTLPATPKIYDGCLVVLHDKKLEQVNRPNDGQQYTSSTDWASPTHTIGGAHVVYSAYGAFGQNTTTTSITITNILPDTIYYASIHICDNVLQYHQPGSQSYSDTGEQEITTNERYTGNIPEFANPPANPALGEVYYNPNTNKVLMWSGLTWVATSEKTIPTGNTFPAVADVGSFFYNDITNTLFAYNGTTWTPANTAQQDVPMFEKLGIGTNGNDRERIELIDSLKSQLGYPAMCAELDEKQFNTSIDLALNELRRRSDSAYYRKHLLMRLQPGQTKYYLNSPHDESDAIVDIIKIQRLNQFGLNAVNADSGIFSQMYFNQFFMGNGVIDLLSIHLIAQLGEEFTKIFAGDLMYQWRESSRELNILRKLYREELVVLESVMEKTEQELLVDRFTSKWIFDWAYANSMEQLGNIRGKYQSLPGPNGISLNGSELLQRADTMKTDLLRQILDYEVGNLVEFGNTSFLIG